MELDINDCGNIVLPEPVDEAGSVVVLLLLDADASEIEAEADPALVVPAVPAEMPMNPAWPVVVGVKLLELDVALDDVSEDELEDSVLLASVEEIEVASVEELDVASGDTTNAVVEVAGKEGRLGRSTVTAA